MNAHPTFAAEKLARPALTKLKAWRKSKLVEDPETGVRRTMRITDVPRLYPGIGVTTWHNWEQPVGHPQFKRPSEANMTRLIEITGGAVSPADFYPVPSNAEG